MSDVLARPVIEIGVDDMRLQDELGGAQRQIAKSMAESLNRTKLEKTERSKLYDITKSLAYLDSGRVKMQAVHHDRVNKSLRQQLSTVKELNRATLTPAMRTLLSTSRTSKYEYAAGPFSPPSVMSGMNAGASTIGAGIAGAGGLAFASAAAAGSTTFNTLTESLKMLSLSAGAKTQAPVLALARLIQKLAKAADTAPNGVVGGIGGALTGAAIGFSRGGLAGAAVGALAGGIGGGAIEKGVNDFADKRQMVAKLKSDPNEIGKLLNEINDLEKPWWSGVPFVGNSVEIAKRRGAIRTAEAKRAQENDDFKTAGIGMSAGHIGLMDTRQGEANAFSSGGALGIENLIKEIKLNTEALSKGTYAAGWQPTVNPGFVGPPAP